MVNASALSLALVPRLCVCRIRRNRDRSRRLRLFTMHRGRGTEHHTQHTSNSESKCKSSLREIFTLQQAFLSVVARREVLAHLTLVMPACPSVSFVRGRTKER